MNKNAYLPTLQDAYNPLSSEQLEILHRQVVSEGEIASVQSRFNYAWGLIKSATPDDQRLGVKLLADIYKDSPQRRRECLFYLTIGCYKLGDYSVAKRYAEALCMHEPDNHQAQALRNMVNDKISRDGLIGFAAVGGALAATAAVAGYFLKKKK